MKALRICLVTICLAAAGQSAEAASIEDSTTGTAFSKATTTNVPLAALGTATSSVCAYTRASSVGTPGSVPPFPPTAACTFSVPPPPQTGTAFTGTGYAGVAKFLANPVPGGLPLTNLNAWAPSSTYPTPVGSSAITASANASVQSTITQPAANVFNYGTTLSASGSVSKFGDNIFVILSSGQAAAQAVDPILFPFTGSGSQGLAYELDLGTPSGSPLGFKSNDPNGLNFVSYTADFFGVSLSAYDGQTFTSPQTLNGQLFSLLIGAAGVIDSTSDISVIFKPWSGLGLSPMEIDTVEHDIGDALVNNADGSVGLPLGDILPLFGNEPGALLPQVVFNSPSGPVTYADDMEAVSGTIPEPAGTWLPYVVLIGLAIWRARRVPGEVSSTG